MVFAGCLLSGQGLETDAQVCALPQFIDILIYLYVQHVPGGKADCYLFAYPYVQGIAQVVYLEGVTAPFCRYDGFYLEQVVLYLEACKSTYNRQPATRHAGDVQSLVAFIVVVVQVQAGGVQE